ncbi:MAG: hypothetical protein ACLFST_02635 [Spirochaetia bacterium]
MKKLLTVSLAVFILILFAACSGGSGSDEYGFKEWTKALKEYNAKLEKVDSADDYAKALESYAKSLKKIEGKMENLIDDFPEIFSGSAEPGDLPKGITEEDLENFATEFGKSFQNAFSMMKYAQDEAVLAVQKKYEDVFSFINE